MSETKDFDPYFTKNKIFEVHFGINKEVKKSASNLLIANNGNAKRIADLQ